MAECNLWYLLLPHSEGQRNIEGWQNGFGTMTMMKKLCPIFFILLGYSGIQESYSAALLPFTPLTDRELLIHQEIMKYGYPGTESLQYHDGYVLSYDARNKAIRWVCERLEGEPLEGIDVSNKNLYEDLSIDIEHRSTSGDYKGTEFSPLSLAPAANHKQNGKVLKDSFLFSSMVLQVSSGSDQNYWKHFESRIQKYAHMYKEFYVITGPLYLPANRADGKRYISYQVIGESQVGVPTHFFKVILMVQDESPMIMTAYVLPNIEFDKRTKLGNFVWTVDDVERFSGLNFWSNLPDDEEDKMEARIVNMGW